MLRLFERDNQSLKLETRYDTGSAEFVVVVHYLDGHEHSERFTDGTAFRGWLEAFEQNLGVQCWVERRLPFVLPYRWPDKPPR